MVIFNSCLLLKMTHRKFVDVPNLKMDQDCDFPRFVCMFTRGYRVYYNPQNLDEQNRTMLDTGEKNGRPTGISLVETYGSSGSCCGS
jgi:hypothetical protein